MNAKLQMGYSGWRNVIKIFIPYVLIVGSFQFMGYLTLGLDINSPVKPEMSTFQSFIISIFGCAGTLLIVWLFCKYFDKERFQSLGFGTKCFAQDISVGLLMGFIILATGFLILLVSNQIQYKWLKIKSMDLVLSIGIFIVVALTEELLVRGYILKNLMHSLNKYLALIISAAIFSLMHGFNPNITILSFITLLLSGILLGLAYVYTKNLWFPIALHFSWNFFQGTIFGFNVSGIDGYSVIIIDSHQSSIWNGGIFGFEGSVLSILFQLIAIIIVYLIFRKREITTVEIAMPKLSLAECDNPSQ